MRLRGTSRREQPRVMVTGVEFRRSRLLIRRWTSVNEAKRRPCLVGHTQSDDPKLVEPLRLDHLAFPEVTVVDVVTNLPPFLPGRLVERTCLGRGDGGGSAEMGCGWRGRRRGQGVVTIPSRSYRVP